MLDASFDVLWGEGEESRKALRRGSSSTGAS